MKGLETKSMCWLLLIVFAEVLQEIYELRKQLASFQAGRNEIVQKLYDFAGLSFYLNLVTDTTKGI